MKILLLDAETAPKRAFVWSMWKNNVSLDQLEADGYILCVCCKWLDERQVHEFSIPSAKSENDKPVLQKVWKLLNEADVVIAHNGKKFDLPTLNARFAIHGMKPPSPYKIVDTLDLARRKFRFTSNRLDALGLFLGLGRKKETGGFMLWRNVMDGCKNSLKKMVAYCKQDVLLLEKVYLRLRPWDNQHPNRGLTDGEGCPVCGSGHLQSRGYMYTKVYTYKRYCCTDCGSWSRDRISSDKNKGMKVL